jgi:hypothetical protein
MSLADANYGDYGMAAATARRRRSQQSIANTLSATLGQKRGERDISKLRRQFIEGFRPEMEKFGARGVAGPNVQSGIQRAGLSRYAANMQETLGGATENLQNEMNTYIRNEADQNAELDAYLKNLDLLKSQNIYNTASALKQYGSY